MLLSNGTLKGATLNCFTDVRGTKSVCVQTTESIQYSV